MTSDAPSHCTECGARHPDGLTCADDFHTMLFWEHDGGLQDVHHLMVACYHIQHPHLYSPEGLRFSINLLRGWVEGGETPAQTRARIVAQVQGSTRTHKIAGTPEHHGSYPHPVLWTMTAADVVAGGTDNFYTNVRLWAQSVLASLRASGNLGTL